MSRPATHDDAALVLQLYDLRREPVLREHRALLLQKFWPRRWDDVQDVLQLSHPFNVAYRQVTTYWEMAYAFCRYGTLHPDLLLEVSGEGLFIYARLEPYLAQIRAATNPRTLRNTEWIAAETELSRAIMDTMRGRVATALAARGNG